MGRDFILLQIPNKQDFMVTMCIKSKCSTQQIIEQQKGPEEKKISSIPRIQGIGLSLQAKRGT